MIGFIGAGHVGITLGRYFHSRGIEVEGYSSRQVTSARKGASLTKSKAYVSLEELVGASRVTMLTTPDDAIEDVVSTLASLDVPWQEKIVCHTSGVHPSTLMKALTDRGATTCSLHPMLSFADMDNALTRLRETPLTLEGQGMLKHDFHMLLENAGLTINEIQTHQKGLYHGAACMVSGYLVALMDVGAECLREAGFSQKVALDLMKPLATATLQNYFVHDATGALSGPIARGDLGTISSHLQALTQQDAVIERIYRILGLRTVDIARRQDRLDEYTLDCLKEVLLNEENNHRINQTEEK